MSRATSPQEGFAQVIGRSDSMKPQLVGQAADRFCHLFQGIHEDAVPVAFEKYVRGSNEPDKIRDGILEFIGDMTFCIPSVVVARGHRGESQKLERREMKILLLWSLTCTLSKTDRWGNFSWSVCKVLFSEASVQFCFPDDRL